MTEVAPLRLKAAGDPAQAKVVLCDPSIYAVISCDDSPALEDYEPETGPIYLLGIVGDQTIGVFILHQAGGHDWWCHVQVLPEYRKQYAEQFGLAVLKWAFRELPNCKKLNAVIPTIYNNVVLFAQRFGFRFEGVNRQSYYKHGKCFDQYYMGLLPWDLLEKR